MPSTTTLIIGAGHAGLAMSHELTTRSIDHVLLERGRVANSWRAERWDSLRLLTPNWQTRLPGWNYTGDDPDGFMTMPEMISYVEDYASSFAAPVHEGVTVRSLRRAAARDHGFDVLTDHGVWSADSVVIATGACTTPRIPDTAADLDPSIEQITPSRYRRPSQLPEGGVLVVGASASGIQIADELNRSGRPVTLAVGRHSRLPRTYRGMDSQWWLDFSGVLDADYRDQSDLARARRAPSLQIVGSPDGRDLDLGVLHRAGVRVAGHLARGRGNRVWFHDDLASSCGDSDRALGRLLDRFDAAAAAAGLDTELTEPTRPAPIDLPTGPDRIDLRREGITSVVWATGFRPHYPWIDLPVLDASGALRHDGGITPVPGLYAIGLPFMRRRRSTYIDGARADAHDLAEHLAQRIGTVRDTDRVEAGTGGGR